MRWRETAAVAAAIAAWCFGAGVPTLARYRDMNLPNGLDQGYFLQRTWQAAALDEPLRTLLNTESGHGLVAGRHFEPILVPIAPLVGVWPDHSTLLLVQVCLLGLALPFVWLLARRVLTAPQAALATVAWIGIPALWQMEAHGFRTMSLATPFVAGTLWAASGGRTGWTLALAVAALSCREEIVWALLASVPWLYAWRGRAWKDTTVALLAVCLAWLVLLAAAHGGPSTFWDLGELPRNLMDRLSQTDGADHTSPLGALGFLYGWLGPVSAVAVLAPLAALPLGVWWVGIQAAHGLAGPEAVHLLGPMVGLLALLMPLALRRLPRRIVTPALVLLAGSSVLFIARDIAPQWRVLANRQPAAAGDHWDLLAHVPAGEAVLTEARYLPALSARERIYATEDWQDPAALDGHYRLALLREGHSWEAHLEARGDRVVRVVPGLRLWATSSAVRVADEALTPE